MFGKQRSSYQPVRSCLTFFFGLHLSQRTADSGKEKAKRKAGPARNDRLLPMYIGTSTHSAPPKTQPSCTGVFFFVETRLERT